MAGKRASRRERRRLLVRAQGHGRMINQRGGSVLPNEAPTPDQVASAPTLRVIEQYIAFRAHATSEGGNANERAQFAQRAKALEAAHPGIEATASRVFSALQSHGKRPDVRTQAADVERLFAGVADTSVPFWQRALRAIAGGAELAPQLLDAYKHTVGAMAAEADAPLLAGKYDVNLQRNQHGELVLRARVHAKDMRVPARLARLIELIGERLERAAKRAP